MKLNKQGYGIYTEKDYFANRSGFTINLSSAVRDAILPQKYMEICVDNGKIIIKPTEEETEYKLSIRGGGQAKMTCCKLARFIDIPEHVRMKAAKNENGTLTIFPKEKR